MPQLDATLKADKSKVASDQAKEPSVPLVVDLDGTLINSNLLVESVIALLKRSLF